MTILAICAVILVALLHVGFLVLEMFLWSRPIGQRVFGLPPDVTAASASLAANQGLYNSFLAAGLVRGVLLVQQHKTPAYQPGLIRSVKLGRNLSCAPHFYVDALQALPASASKSSFWPV
jgi:uncharacterized membrane protein